MEASGAVGARGIVRGCKALVQSVYYNTPSVLEKARLQIEVLYMIHRPSEFDADFEIETDVVIVGARPRRSAAAYKLASLVVAWLF